MPKTQALFANPKNYKLQLAILIAFIMATVIGVAYFLRDLPSPTNLSKPIFPVSTKIYDRHGSLLYEIYADQNRTPVAISDLPQYLIQATIAIEDKRFFHHHGFDTQGIIRAMVRITTGRRLEGGSTITQQLVKVALLTPDRTIERKLKEAILALATEVLYSKNQILEMYLNHIPYGGTAYGIESAAKLYFGKSARDLTLAEASLLAGLPQAPTTYSPFSHSESAKARQAQVLDRMVEDGYISREAAEEAKKASLDFASPGTDLKAPHFVMYVRDQLVEKYGLRKVEQGGLRVTTTLDLELQEDAQASVAAELKKIARLKISNGAALVTNPQTGEILAMVGSRNYFDKEIDGKVNVTTRPRQPGSSIKPLNYALALESKTLTPSSLLLDTPICFKVQGQKDYCPKNYDNTFRGPTQIRYALGNSLNIPAVKVLALNGIDNFINFARRLGITTWQNPDNYGLSLTLGGGEVYMTDMATSFGVFANYGTRVPLQSILKVEDFQGNVLEEYKPNLVATKVDELREDQPTKSIQIDDYKIDKVLSSETSFLISHILSDNNARSAAFGPNSVLNVRGKLVSVKTGTTNNLRDNWTIGYTKDRLVAVWVGNNDNSPMSYVASGVTGASPIWRDIMQYVLVDRPTPEFKIPKGIEVAQVCADTGILPRDGASCSTRGEFFIAGSTPTTLPVVKREIWVNKNTGRPPTNEEEFQDVELREHTIISDPFVQDYCVDCAKTPADSNEDNGEENPLPSPEGGEASREKPVYVIYTP